MDEKMQLKKLQRGDTRVLEQLMWQYSAYVVTVIKNRSRNMLSVQDIEEVAADVFVALWRSARSIRPGHIRQWLGSVARNKTVDRLRKLDITIPLDNLPLSVDDTLWDAMVQQEREAHITAALESLSSTDREIFFRHYDLCQNAQDIADIMKLNASTVRTRLSRGRVKLKQILLKGGFLHEDEL